MLVDWISTGHLLDKSEEFMVKEATSITKEQLDLDFTDEYWERRYTVRLSFFFPFLSFSRQTNQSFLK